MPSEIPYAMVTTPDPNELAFWVLVNTHDITIDNMPVSGVTTMGNLKLPTAGRPFSSYDDYVYTMPAPAETVGFLRLFFAKDKTAAESEVPFRETPEMVPKSWYPILLELKPHLDPLPRATAVVRGDQEGIAQSDRYYWTRKYIPDVAEGTKRILREYLSPRKFEIKQYEAPQPGEVYIELPGGGDISFPKCLHKAFTVQGVRAGVVSVIGETGSSLQSATDDLHFPATNFTTWQPYIGNVNQQFTNGVWYMTDELWIPPPLPRIIKR